MSLIELDAPENLSAGGIEIPDHTPSAEENQQAAKRPTQPPGVTGVIREIGPWPKLKNGKALMPEFGLGQRVVIRPTAGQEMNYGPLVRLKTIWNDDVLAVIF